MHLKASQTDLHAKPPTAAASRWLFLVPSVSDLLFVGVLMGLSFGALGRILLRDAGTGWHIRNGQLMLHSHSITRFDTFSATMSGQPWYAWEWLYDLLIAAVHHGFGLNGVVFYTAAIIAATFVLVFHLAMRRGGSLPITLCLLVLSMGATAIHFLARPHVVSWLFSVIWFEVLDSAASAEDRKRVRQIYWLPVLMLLWVNLHGGFVFGFALLLVYLVGGIAQYLGCREQRIALGRWLRTLGFVIGLSVLASFVNPYGYKLHLHIFQYLSDHFLMDRVSEFLSPDFHGVAQQCFAALLLVAIAALASARRRLEPARLLVVLLAAYSGLYASRNLPVSSMLLTLLLAPLLSESVAKASEDMEIASWLRSLISRVHAFGVRMGKSESNFHGHVWMVLAFAIGLWACLHGGRIGSQQLIHAYFDEKRFPAEAAQLIVERDIREPIFCPDQWGGYLIYRLYPQTKVLVDDRHDLYGDKFFKDYLRVVYVQPGWDRVLAQENANWVVMQKDSSLATILGQTPSWELVHSDSTAALFHRIPIADRRN